MNIAAGSQISDAAVPQKTGRSCEPCAKRNVEQSGTAIGGDGFSKINP
jgi:hypothetical protein